MEIAEKVSGAFLRNMFDSRAFSSGLARIIAIGNKTGCEAAFAVVKKPMGGRVLYTPVFVGNEQSVGYESLSERARKNGGKFTEDFPDERAGNQWRLESKSGDMASYYPLVCVHTHNRSIAPSGWEKDLGHLSELRMNGDYESRFFPNTISVIAGFGSNSNFSGVMFTQEKTEFPIIMSGQMKISAEAEINEFLKRTKLASRLGAGGDRLMELVTVGNDERKFYNLGYALFDNEKKKLVTGDPRLVFPVDFKDYAFQSQYFGKRIFL